MRWATGVLAVAVAVPAAAQQVEVTLADAIQRAMLVQPRMVSARGPMNTKPLRSTLSANCAFSDKKP